MNLVLVAVNVLSLSVLAPLTAFSPCDIRLAFLLIHAQEKMTQKIGKRPLATIDKILRQYWGPMVGLVGLSFFIGSWYMKSDLRSELDRTITQRIAELKIDDLKNTLADLKTRLSVLETINKFERNRLETKAKKLLGTANVEVAYSNLLPSSTFSVPYKGAKEQRYILQYAIEEIKDGFVFVRARIGLIDGKVKTLDNR